MTDGTDGPSRPENRTDASSRDAFAVDGDGKRDAGSSALDSRDRPNQDATSKDGGVEVSAPEPAPPPLAYEPFAGGSRALSGSEGGWGWGQPWLVQNDNVDRPGCEIGGAGSLSVGSLQTEGLMALGGCSYLSMARRANRSLNGPFSSHLNGRSGLVGKEGETLWISFVLRKDVANDESMYVGLGAKLEYNTEWNQGVAVGYFGPNSNQGQDRFWGIQVGPNVHAARKITIGAPAFFVAAITFGTPSSVQLFVNPSDLNSGPKAPEVTLPDQGRDLDFEWLIVHLGDTPNNGALDEIRIGTSWKSVAPVAR